MFNTFLSTIHNDREMMQLVEEQAYKLGMVDKKWANWEPLRRGKDYFMKNIYTHNRSLFRERKASLSKAFVTLEETPKNPPLHERARSYYQILLEEEDKKHDSDRYGFPWLSGKYILSNAANMHQDEVV